MSLPRNPQEAQAHRRTGKFQPEHIVDYNIRGIDDEETLDALLGLNEVDDQPDTQALLEEAVADREDSAALALPPLPDLDTADTEDEPVWAPASLEDTLAEQSIDADIDDAFFDESLAVDDISTPDIPLTDAPLQLDEFFDESDDLFDAIAADTSSPESPVEERSSDDELTLDDFFGTPEDTLRSEEPSQENVAPNIWGSLADPVEEAAEEEPPLLWNPEEMDAELPAPDDQATDEGSSAWGDLAETPFDETVEDSSTDTPYDFSQFFDETEDDTISLASDDIHDEEPSSLPEPEYDFGALFDADPEDDSETVSAFDQLPTEDETEHDIDASFEAFDEEAPFDEALPSLSKASAEDLPDVEDDNENPVDDEDDDDEHEPLRFVMPPILDPLKKVGGFLKSIYMAIVNLFFKIVQSLLGILSSLPLIGGLVKPLQGMTSLLQNIALALPVVFVIGVIVLVWWFSAPSSDTVELPDMGSAKVSSFSYDRDTGEVTATVENTGDIIAETSVDFSVRTLQPTWNPISWAVPEEVSTCSTEAIVEIENSIEVTASCDVDVEGFFPRTTGEISAL